MSSQEKIIIPIKNTSSYPNPTYSTTGSAGLDLQADIHKIVVLQPLERTLIPTGIYLEIPLGYEAQVRPRSGLALKKGITVLNAPGTIDSDYRGEIGVILVNLSQEAVEIQPGDRIAQLVISQYQQVEWISTEHISTTDRSDKGFGSTGT